MVVNPVTRKDFEGLYPVKEMGKEVFSSLEMERGTFAAILQDDIYQLISIAKMRLTGNTAAEVNSYLALALKKLCMLAFEIKPQVLEEFGLASALQALLAQRLVADVNYSSVKIHRLPQGMNVLIQTAVFRLLQQILNSISLPHCTNFGLDITRVGHFISLKVNFKADILTANSTEVYEFKNKLIKAVQPVMYCFNGHAHFQLLPSHVIIFSVCLDERKATC